MFSEAMQDNLDQIRRAVAAEEVHGTALQIVDLGCWDGSTTATYVARGATVIGVEGDLDAGAQAARQHGWEIVKGDLNQPLTLESECCDVVTSNQVIEHLSDTDCFMSEAYRLLRPGGLVVVSTENLSSWHNIASLVFGWQAFSLTNISNRRSGIGNPLANLRAAEPCAEGWAHQRIFSYRGLIELAEAVGFHEVRILGAGYYPLPTRVAHRDPRHAAFITVVGRKPR